MIFMKFKRLSTFLFACLLTSVPLCAMQTNNNDLELAWVTSYSEDDTDMALASAAGAGRLTLINALLNNPKTTSAGVNYALRIAALNNSPESLRIIIHDKRIILFGIMEALYAAENIGKLENTQIIQQWLQRTYLMK
jgi:hypothetical protein